MIVMPEDKRLALSRQLEPQLNPILRPKDYEIFDLEKAFRIVKQMADVIQ